jgi:DNA-binding CsgD family transcriptional regulator
MMMSKLDALILKLHSDCRALPLAGFQDWAVDLLGDLVPFDQVVWSSGVIIDGFPQLRTNFLRGLTPEFIQALNKHFHLDPQMGAMTKQSGVTFNRDGHDLAQVPKEFRRLVLDPADLRYSLVTLFIEEGSGVFAGLSFNRSASSKCFEEHERQLVQRLIPHMFEAYSANQIVRALDMLDAGLNATYTSLVTTSEGIVIAVEPGAKLMLQAQWSHWKGAILPSALLEKLFSKPNPVSGQGYLFGKLYIRIYWNANRCLLRMRFPNVLDSLGPRERTVAERFAGGDSCKEIAKVFGVSPSTVNNQVAQIYRKLAISNKAELATKLHQLE